MMKYLMIALTLIGLAQSGEYKAVFDCSSDNARFIMSRMSLVEKTMAMIEKKDDKATLAITLHGGCVAMSSSAYADIIDDSDLIYIKKAQESLKRLSAKHVDITACAMSLNANGLEQKEVLPFIKISENSFIDTIGYQNSGYALMTFK